MTPENDEQQVQPQPIRFPYGKVPVPDWNKRVLLDAAVAMIVYSPGNGQEFCT